MTRVVISLRAAQELGNDFASFFVKSVVGAGLYLFVARLADVRCLLANVELASR